MQRQFMQGVQGTCGMPWVVAWGIRTRMLWALEACFDGLGAAVHVKVFLSRFVSVLVASLYRPQDRMGRKKMVMGGQVRIE